MTNVCIVGDGGWGTALALVLRRNGHRVTVWGPFPDYIRKILEWRENRLYLPGVDLPPEIRWTADRADAVAGAEVVVLAVPSRFYRDVAQSFAGRLPASCRIVSVAKGLDSQTHERMTQVAAAVFPGVPVAALSGPSHAEEVARGIPTAVVAASTDAAVAGEIQRLFADRQFRVYTADDVIGVELGGALKNVIAVAAGVGDGIGFGDNAKAALMTRGLAEITRLGVALGARPLTFAGLSGMGDLIVTCSSRHSRNRGVGERIGRGERLDNILKEMKQVAEGVWNCSLVCDLARQARVPAPIAEEVHAIIHDGKNPHDAVESLMTRDMKAE